MDLYDIKRGLRAEIKKRENEQYLTFQCNVRQMCKDVLAKLEEQESVIAEKDEELRHHKYKRCLAMARWCNERFVRIEKDYAFWRYGKDYAQNFYKKWKLRWLKIAEQFKDKEA